MQKKRGTVNLMSFYFIVLIIIFFIIFIFQSIQYHNANEFDPTIVKELNETDFYGYRLAELTNSSFNKTLYTDYNLEEKHSFVFNNIQSSMILDVQQGEMIYDSIIIQVGENFTFTTNLTKLPFSTEKLLLIEIESLDSSKDLKFELHITQLSNKNQLYHESQILMSVFIDGVIMIIAFIFQKLFVNVGGFWSGYPRSSIQGQHRMILLLIFYTLIIIRMILYIG